MGSGTSRAAALEQAKLEPTLYFSDRAKTVRQFSQQQAAIKTEADLARRESIGKCKVFISYSEEDCGSQTVDNFVHFVKAKLLEKGYRSYVTEDELGPNDDRGHLMMETIQPIPVLVSICSSSYGRQKWANRECDLASRLGKPIVPLLYSGSYPPARLNLVHLPKTFVDFRDKSKWMVGIDDLVVRIKDAIAGKRPPELLAVEKLNVPMLSPVPRTSVPTALPDIRKSPRPSGDTAPPAPTKRSPPPDSPKTTGTRLLPSPSIESTDSADSALSSPEPKPRAAASRVNWSAVQHGANNDRAKPKPASKRFSMESFGSDDDEPNWDDMPLYDYPRPQPPRPRVLVPLLKYDLSKLDNSLDPAVFVKTDDAIMYPKKPKHLHTMPRNSKSALPVKSLLAVPEPPKKPTPSPISDELTKLLDMIDSADWEK
eukprot:TRINITY_DN1502_c0_g1_i4.p1 TRINITY_DN1502_c0_g1~~TRINITY_DN1502_c0_g1_i4.p1  ORF type:complete len:428 (+),score=92.72 TRINITY_DN1502_c0_g1_i4:107-1390(+)